MMRLERPLHIFRPLQPTQLPRAFMQIQQGTNHAWVNRGTEPCRIAFILIDAQEP